MHSGDDGGGGDGGGGDDGDDDGGGGDVLIQVTRSKGDSWLSPFRKLPCGSFSLAVDLFSLCVFPAPELTGSNLEVVQGTG